VSDVGDVRVIAGDSALLIDHDEIVDEVDDRDQTLGCEEQPGKLERPHKHHAPGQREDRGRSAQHSAATGHKNDAEDEAHQAAREKDRQELVRADGFFQRAAEDEKKEHVAEQMQNTGVHKQRAKQCPDSALLEIVKTEDEISFGERRVLLPSPDAGHDARENQQ